ncbi:hypothetical protein LX73_1336 [Fodinibius salinus]|uniref:Thioredoxin domain-containing protein n=1 Tax=Fodinibius salinus TaxID=860790 RepID=A0A5D3YNA0_9BACT|nr:hypothetical protein [Fodinibius salinus]TYP93629.1 hypothetical protein LX73_1336 [Fodinibius salinus]
MFKSKLTHNVKLWLAVAALFSLNCYFLFITSSDINNDKTAKEIKQKVIFSQTNKNIFVDKLLLSKNRSELQLITLFPKSYCPASIELELPKLKKLAQDYSKAITVLDIGMRYDINKLVGKKLKMVSIDDLSQLIPINEKQVTVPIMLVIDQNGLVQLSYVSNDKNPQKSTWFFRRVNSLFNSVYK